jgi:hypothetical protein
MNRKEAMRQTHQMNTLQSLGFTADEAESLRRISMTLRRWHELECGTGDGHIERDEKTGIPRYHNDRHSYLAHNDPRAWSRIPDRETGARKRLAEIIAKRNAPYRFPHHQVSTYIQTDPRGAALYIIRPVDVPAGSDVDSCYSRGICVY